MSEMCMVHIVWCVVIMFGMPPTCTQDIYCTRYKQCSQSYSDYAKTWIIKSFQSYLGQFSTIFYVSEMEIDESMCRNVVQLTL